MKTQLVYIPTSDSNTLLQVGSIDNNDYYKSFTKERDVKEIEAYVFTQEELKKLLEDYTNRIVDNVEVINKAKFKGDCNPQVDKESITSQLTAYLKQLE